jgi:hypothetical protein
MKRTAFAVMVCVGALLAPGLAEAQYGARQRSNADDRAVGERYNVEIAANFWTPSPELVISSEQFGIVGTEIDAVADLGFDKQRFRGCRLVLRPSRKFKFRLGYTPITFDTQTTLRRTIVFNGQRYDVGLPVNSTLEWNAWQFGLEWDFIYRSRGFVGFIAEAKYTDLDVALATPIGSLNEFTRVRVPVPTIGGIARVYPLRNLAVTGEVTGLKLAIDQDEGRYLEYDVNGTFNVTNNFGVRAGYRSLSVNYRVDNDRGDLTLTGLYFGGIARF